MPENVVLVVWDTVRGSETVPADPALTPTLASLAEQGTEFTNVFSAAPWTLPAHGSLFTGTYPSRHHAHAESAFLDDRLPVLPEHFGNAGYETMAVSNNTWIAEEFGFARGFETFLEHSIRRSVCETGQTAESGVGWDLGIGRLRGFWRNIRDGVVSDPPDDGAERTVGRVRSWLESRTDDRPFFLFLNFVESHLPYRPPRRFGERWLPAGWSYDEATDLPQDPRAFDAGEFSLSEEEWSVLRGLYRGEIAYLDAQLSNVKAALESADVWEDTLLVVTSDHGENIGEHRLLGHQYCLYDTVLHIPLVISGGAFTGGLDEPDRVAQTVDLAPTLLDAAGIDPGTATGRLQGRSLHPTGGIPSRNVLFAEYRGPRPPVERLEARFDDIPRRIYTFQRGLRSVRTSRFKFIRGSDGSRRLYDLERDPEESDDVLSGSGTATSELESTLDDWLSSFAQVDSDESATISPTTQKQLANLGYM